MLVSIVCCFVPPVVFVLTMVATFSTAFGLGHVPKGAIPFISDTVNQPPERCFGAFFLSLCCFALMGGPVARALSLSRPISHKLRHSKPIEALSLSSSHTQHNKKKSVGHADTSSSGAESDASAASSVSPSEGSVVESGIPVELNDDGEEAGGQRARRRLCCSNHARKLNVLSAVFGVAAWVGLLLVLCFPESEGDIHGIAAGFYFTFGIFHMWTMYVLESFSIHPGSDYIHPTGKLARAILSIVTPVLLICMCIISLIKGDEEPARSLEALFEIAGQVTLLMYYATHGLDLWYQKLVIKVIPD
ncbi:hypothetical protein Pelo_13377 [Pelomyxa schiedti]|nr:hypothetical protein Pelo_13377 [Pelomyxa schiedti]